MIQGTLRSWSTYLGAAALLSSLAACTIQEAPKRSPLNTTPDDKVEQPATETDPILPETNKDSGAFGKSTSSSGGTSGTIVAKKFCGEKVVAGDLAVTEIMISSKTGSGDSGEWAEITNTRDCWLHLDGVSVESPRGTAATDTASFDGVFDLAPNGTFIVADSDDATKNHGLPGKVISWDATDVLKNDGDTITVKLGNVEITKTTYPSLQLATPGNSITFPADCPSSDRTDWLKWTASTDMYSTLKGTPNATNDDVSCK